MTEATPGPSGLERFEAALQASLQAGAGSLRSAVTVRLLQALLLLAGATALEAGTSVAAALAVALFAGGGAAAIAAGGPSRIWAAARPEGRSARHVAAFVAAGLRMAAALLPVLAPIGAGAGLAAAWGDPEVRVGLALALAPLVLAGVGLGVGMAARLGPAPLLAATGLSPGRALRAAWRGGRRGRVLPQVTLLGLELLAALVATSAAGLMAPAEVFAAPWSVVIALELEAAALWRMLGAPVLVLSVFVQIVHLRAEAGRGDESRCQDPWARQNGRGDRTHHHQEPGRAGRDARGLPTGRSDPQDGE